MFNASCMLSFVYNKRTTAKENYKLYNKTVLITPENLLAIAKKTILSESNSISKLAELLTNDFVTSTNIIYNSKGRLIVTGIGKSAIIAQKIVASMNSTGTPSMFLHASEAIHGDLGMVQPEDVVICIGGVLGIGSLVVGSSPAHFLFVPTVILVAAGVVLIINTQSDTADKSSIRGSSNERNLIVKSIANFNFARLICLLIRGGS